MSINPLITHSSPTQSLYAPFGVINGNIPFTDVLVSEAGVGTQTIGAIAGNPGIQQTGISGTTQPYIIQNVTGVSEAGSVITTGPNSAFWEYGNGNPNVVKGTITITNNIGGGSGGVGIEGEDGSTLAVGNGAVTVGGNADLVAPTVNGRELGKVAEWLDRNAAPQTFTGINNVTQALIESFTTLTVNNYYRVTAFVAVEAGAGVASTSDLRFSMAAGGEGLVDLMTVTGGMIATGETWTGTISAIVQETSAGDPLNLVADGSDAGLWDITVYSGQIENLGTVLSGVPDPF